MSTLPTVQINNVSLDQLTYRDVPVVTFQQIADVHGIDVQNVQKAFRRHAERFTEGKHYFRLDFTAASQLVPGVLVSHNGLYVFTEKGYLLLAKPMKDDTSWQVQERMIDDYFSLKTLAEPQYHNPQTAMFIEALKRLDAFEAREAQRLERERAMLAQMLVNQEKTIEALQRSLRAESKADLALADAHTMTLEDFILKNGLLRQFPRNQWRRCVAWLKLFCAEWGLSIIKSDAIDKGWAMENAYPVQALAALLRAETTKPRQLAIVPKEAKAEEGE